MRIYQTGGNNKEGTTVYYVCETNSTLVEGTPLWYYSRSVGGQVEFVENAQGRFSQQIIRPNTTLFIGRDLRVFDSDQFRCSVPSGLTLTLSLLVQASQCVPGCLNGGTCHGNMCMCPAEYTGDFCETRLSYCPIRCLNGGYCDNGNCVCQEGYAGNFCQIAVSDEFIIRLSFPSTQRPTLGTTLSIICEVFESPTAAEAVRGTPLLAQWEVPDPVSPQLLPGIPVDGVISPAVGDIQVRQLSPSASLLTITNFQPVYTGSYNCSTGTRTVTYYLSVECAPPCLNEGACVNGRCQCYPGYTGDRCETPPSEMLNKDCRYACANNGTCDEGVCLCLNGFRGDWCEIDFRALTNDPCGCLNGGTCEQGECRCPPGFSGAQCEREDGICNPPCQNGGSCLDGVCHCDLGYVGFYCEFRACIVPCINGDCIEGVCLCDPGFTGEQCNLHECTVECLNGGVCYNGTCSCLQGFTGEQCQEVDCLFPCLNGATCVEGLCQCALGFAGDQCDELACILPCINGDCIEGECICYLGYEGEQCDVLSCQPECVNGGLCVDGVCVCLQGYDGLNCETEVPYIEIIPEQSVVRYGMQLSWRCIYHFGTQSPFWRNPNQRFVQLAQSLIRGDLGLSNVFAERISVNETRLVIVDFRPGDSGVYSCGTFEERETILIEATATTTSAPTSPSITVTIPPSQTSNCVPFNSSICRGLPYQQALFPTSFAQDAAGAELVASAMSAELADCGKSPKVVLCYLFFQPCEGGPEPPDRLCREICQAVQHECKAYMREVLTYLADQAEQFLGVCGTLPLEESQPSCIKSLKKQPPTLSKCDGMCENGGTCLNDKCVCEPDFTGEMCEYPVGTPPEYDVVITPIPPGYPEVTSNLTVMCEVINSNILAFPIWFGPDNQNIPQKQPGDSNQRIYIDPHSPTASKLIILGVQPSDQGTYRCIVGQQSVPHTVILKFPDCYSQPCLNGGVCIQGKCQCPYGFTGLSCENSNVRYIISITPETIDFPVTGSNLTFLCEVTGLYPSNPIWLNANGRNIGGKTGGGSNRVFVQETSPTETVLNIFNLQPQDSGVYVCVVEKQYTYVNITVRFPPSFSLIITPAPNQTPVVGGNLVFLCEMTRRSNTSSPFWVAPDGRVVTSRNSERGDGIHVVFLGRTAVRLVITNLRERDEGIYSCIAGPIEATVNITVFEPQCERPCLYGSACIRGSCLCPYGLEGEACEIQVPGTECDLPCANDGLCVNNQCFCKEGYLGELCQIFVGGTFNITVVTIDDLVPVSSGDVQIVCAVEGDGVFPPPMWINPRGFTIAPIGEGGSQHMNVEMPQPGTTLLNINDITTEDEGTYTCIVGEYINTYIFRIGVSDQCDYPCANGGTCVEGLCLCPLGYLGRFCEVYIPVAECKLPCQNGGVCRNGICYCPIGYTEPSCNVKVGVGYFLYIVSNLQRPPLTGEELRVTCKFVGGQRMDRPEWTDPNNLPIPTNEGGLQRVYVQYLNATATQLIFQNVQPRDLGTYTCNVGDTTNTFTNTFSVTVSEPECSPLCQNGGTCRADGCQCTEDFTGVFCQTPVLHKCDGLCLNGGVCVAGNCRCVDGFTGANCERPVVVGCRQPCANGGLCINSACLCQPGFSGEFCQETDSDCIPICENGGSCSDGVCVCADKYTGDTCNIRVDEDLILTVVPSTLTPPSVGDDIRVSCEFLGSSNNPQPFWTAPDGHQIEYVLPELIGTRRVGSIANSSSTTSLFINDVRVTDTGTYTCFVGPVTNTYTILFYDFNCDPVCRNGGFCSLGTCQCPKGYRGTACELQVVGDECRPRCENQGVCKNGMCECGPQHDGQHCETTVGDGYFLTISNQPYEPLRRGQDLTVTCEFVGEGEQAAQPAWRDPNGILIRPSVRDDSGSLIRTRAISPLKTELTISNIQPTDSGIYTCHVGSSVNTLTIDFGDGGCAQPCMNGGTCIGGVCECPDGFSGERCDTPVVECVIPCENNGQCLNGICVCSEGYFGNLCEVAVGDGLTIHIIKDSLGPHQTGQDVIVTCEYTSDVGQEFQPQWIDRSGRSISPNTLGRLRTLIVSPTSTQLTISGIQESDSGVYACVVGTEVNTYTLTIHDVEVQCALDCLNGGVCVRGTCECPEQYGGAYCEFELTPCDFPCANGGICIEGVCSCVDGFQGEFCQTYVIPETDIIITITLQENALPAIGQSFYLVCEIANSTAYPQPVWITPSGNPVPSEEEGGPQSSHHMMTEDISPTATKLILNRLMREDSGTYTCLIGPHRDSIPLIIYKIPCSPACQNGGTCDDGVCLCPTGFTGDHCQEREQQQLTIRITPSMQELPHVGDRLRVTCEIIGTNEFSPPEWQTPDGAVIPEFVIASGQRVGVQYITSTATNLVINSVRPADAGRYTCNIGPLQGFFEVRVERPPNCEVVCENMGVCLGRECQCPEEFAGPRCEIRRGADYTIVITPPPNPVLVPGVHEISYLCEIESLRNLPRPEWAAPSGSLIAPIEQIGSIGRLGVEYIDSRSTRLIIRDLMVEDSGMYTCYIGTLTNTVMITVQVPSCLPPCLNGGQCSNGACECPPEFTGPQCQTPALPCPQPCINGGECVNRACVCPAGFLGSRCEIPGFNVKLHPVGEVVPVIGRTISFLCQITGQVLPDIRPRWRKENAEIRPQSEASAGRVFTSYVSPSATQLTIQGMQSSDAGSYICDVGPVIATFRIEVQELPCPQECQNGGTCVNGVCQCPEGYSGTACQAEGPQNIRIQIVPIRPGVPRIGEDIAFTCIILGPTPFLNPTWKTPGGQPVARRNALGGSNARLSEEALTSTATTLFINSVSYDDAGIYVCMVGPVMANFSLEVAGLECRPSCQNGGTCLDGICTCPPEFTGHYCQTPVPEKVTVNIRQIGNEIPSPGSSLQFECVSMGNSDPRSAPIWRNPAGQRVLPLGQGGSQHLYVRQSSPSAVVLVINNVNATDAGKYECAVGNVVASLIIRISSIGSAQCFPSCQNGGSCVEGVCLCLEGYIGGYCQIAVQTPHFDIQILLDPDQPQQLVIGDDLQLTCQIPEDSPLTNPQWYTPDGQRVFSIGQGGSDKLHVELQSVHQTVLTIMNVQASDSGTYTCSVGPHRATFIVDVSIFSCRQPCMHGGSCVMGRCECAEGYRGDMCQVATFDIRIQPPPTEVPRIGYNITFICEVSERAGYRNPSWLGPSGQQIYPAGQDFGSSSRVFVRELSYLASELIILDLQLSDEGIYTCAVGPLSTTQEVFIEVGCSRPCFNGGRCVSSTCECPNNYRGEQCEIPFGFDIRIVIPENLMPMVGDDVSFTCEVGYESRFRNPVWRNSSGQRVFTKEQGGSEHLSVVIINEYSTRLVISGLSTSDSGTYVCTAGPLYRDLTLQIQGRPCDPPCSNSGTCVDGLCQCPDNYVGTQCETFVPPFNIRILPLENPSPSFGDNLTIDCVVHPSGFYRNPIWRGPDGRQINTMARGGTMRLHTEQTSPFSTRLVIEMVSEEDRGNYQCQAGPFSAQLVINIPVQECIPPCINGGRCVNGKCRCPPSWTGNRCQTPDVVFPIRIIRPDETPRLGGNFSVLCEVPLNSQYTMPIWLDASRQMVPKSTQGHLYAVAESDHLTRLYFTGVRRSDRGTYTCVTGPLSVDFTINIPGGNIDCISPCLNGGSCINQQCVCPQDYTGDQCQTKEDVLVIIPDTLTPRIGQDISFLCEIPAERPFRNPTWLSPDNIIIDSYMPGRNEHMFVAVESPRSTRLYIRGLTPSDSGQYTCSAGPHSSEFNIVVTVPQCENECLNGGQCVLGQCQCLDGFTGEQCETNVPDNRMRIVGPDVLFPVVGQNLEFLCEVPPTSEFQMPVWLDKNGEIIPKATEGHLYAVAENDHSTRLVFSGLLLEDSGSYRCVTGTLSSRINLQVTGLDRWIVVSPNKVPTVPSIGDNLRIICEVAEDSPYTNPKWLGPDNEEVRPLGSIGVGRIGVQNVTATSATLVIDGLQAEDAGTYTCVTGPLQYIYRVSPTLDCSANPCRNDADCQDGKCVCQFGFTGFLCESLVECPQECQNGGSCMGGECLCPNGYDGDYCETENPQAFIIRVTKTNPEVPIVGGNLVLLCEVGPNSRFQRPVWQDPQGRDIGSRTDGATRVYTVNPDPTSSHLYISGLSLEDAGTYTCSAGPLKYNYNVVVLAVECNPPCINGGSCTVSGCRCPPGYIGQQCQEIDPNYLQVDVPAIDPVYGGDFSLLCVLPEGSPLSSLRPYWVDPLNRPIPPIEQGGTVELSTEQVTPQSSRLIFRNLQVTTSGTYTCVAGPIRYRYDLLVELPSCFPECKNGGACVGDVCICPIGLTGEACEDIVEGFVVVQNPDIDPPVVGDTIKFVCEVPASSTYGQPMWLSPDGDQITLLQGENDNMGTEIMSPYSTSLLFRDIRLEDAGTYICKVGPIRQGFNVTVTDIPCEPVCQNGGMCITGICQCPANYIGPRCNIPVGVFLTIRRPPKPIFDVGEDVILTCEVSENSPFENPVWLDQFDAEIDEGILNEVIGTRNVNPFTTQLIIHNIQLNDRGDYTCMVGPIRQTVTLLVQGEEIRCPIACMNGGTCVNQVCLCPEDWYGTECQTPVGGFIQIVQPPGQVIGMGLDVAFLCQVVEGDHFVINPEWQYRSTRIAEATEGEVNRVFVEKVSPLVTQLVIRDLTIDDLGDYYCFARPLSLSFELTVSDCEPPCMNGGSCVGGRCVCLEGLTGVLCETPVDGFVVIDVPEDQVPVIGGQVVYVCEVPESNPFGPPMWVTAQGRAVQPATAGSIVRVSSSQVTGFSTALFINNLQVEDLAGYTCIVGPIRHPLIIDLPADICTPPCLNGGTCVEGQCVCPAGLNGTQCEMMETGFIVVSPPKGQVPFVGLNITFICLVPEGNIYSNPVWLLPTGEEVPFGGGAASSRVYSDIVSPEATSLNFIRLQLQDSGTYTCKVGPVQFSYSVVAVVPECDPPCRYGGTCSNGVCQCPFGFKGRYCEFIDFSIEIEQPPEQNPEIGSDAEFTCVIDSRSPYTNPVWFNRDGLPITTAGEGSPGGSTRVYTEPLDEFSTRMVLRDLEISDSGTYMCSVGPIRSTFTFFVRQPNCGLGCFNGGSCVAGACQCPEGFTGNYCEVLVQQPFIIKIDGSDDQPNAGDSISFVCSVPGGSNYGNPIWLDTNGDVIVNQNEDGGSLRQFAEPLSASATRLVFNQIQEADAGNYSCIVGLNRAILYISVRASECRTPCANGGTCIQGSCVCPSDYVGGFCQNIISQEYQFRIRIQKGQNPVVGDNMRILCEIRGSSPYRDPQWIDPRGNVIYSKELGGSDTLYTRQSATNSKLYIQGVTLADAGTYTCQVGPLTTEITIMPRRETCVGPCLNGGVCQDGVCRCAMGYAGESCEIPVDLSGDGLTITITPSIDREPRRGENVTYRCEIQENEIYMKPVWRDEAGNIIDVALPGQERYTEPVNTFVNELTILDISPEHQGVYSCSVGPITSFYPVTVAAAGCIPDCINDGACINEACLCPDGYSGDFCQIETFRPFDLNVTVGTNYNPVVGGEVSYLCEAVGTHALENPTWYNQYGVPIGEQDEVFSRIYTTNVSSFAQRLVIKDINEIDAGIYTCEAGPRRTSIVLSVYVPECLQECQNGGSCVEGMCVCPERIVGQFCEYSLDRDFRIYLRPSTPDGPGVGGSYSIECDIVGPVRIGTPEWTGPGGQRVRGLGLGGTGHKYADYLNPRTTALIVNGVIESDEGPYRCTVGPLSAEFNITLAPTCDRGCMHGGVCRNGVCDCPEPFTGDYCDSIEEGCNSLRLCYNGGTCNNKKCICTADYQGDFCQYSIDDETTLRIELGRGDIPEVGENVTFMCITSGPDAPINPEWVMRTGEVILSLEDGGDLHRHVRRLSPTQVQLVLIDLIFEDIDTYSCRAGPLRKSVSLVVRTPPCEPECVNGFCLNTKCICLDGFTGEACHIRISECDPPCLNGGMCENRLCLCPRGFYGELCENIQELPVAITIRPEQDQITYVGENSAFLCYTEGDGAPSALIWRDPSGQIIQPGVPGGISRVFVELINETASRLVINFLSEEDAGLYNCAAGPLNSSVIITLYEHPCPLMCANEGTCIQGRCRCPGEFIGKYCEIRVSQTGSIAIVPNIKHNPMVGEDLEFLCRTAGRIPSRNPVWRFPNGKVVRSVDKGSTNDRVYAERNPPYQNTLVIHNFTEADVGTYQCRAGPLTTSFTLVLAERICDPPCFNGGTCEKSQCVCPEGFTGNYCQIKDCQPPCLNGGECVGEVCKCPPGWAGRDCGQEEDVALQITQTTEFVPTIGSTVIYVCYTNESQVTNSPVWVYPDGREIPVGDPGDGTRIFVETISVAASQLIITSLQEEDIGTYSCSAGPLIASVVITMNPSDNSCHGECLNGGVCNNEVCFCPPAYTGEFCQLVDLECRYPCENGGSCISGICVCMAEFEGVSCEIKKRGCAQECQNGGICLSGQCRCQPGFAGDFCEKRPIQCEPPCMNGGICVRGQCYCAEGFKGDSCELIVDLSPQIIINPFSGQVLALGEDVNFLCRLHSMDQEPGTLPVWVGPEGNAIGKIGFGGDLHKYVEVLPESVVNLIINDFTLDDAGNYTCISGPLSGMVYLTTLPEDCEGLCLNGGICVNGICECAEGFQGEQCEFSLGGGLCSPACENGATCEQGVCLCAIGFTGETCGIEMTCNPACENNAICQRGICMCPVGFTGPSCTEDINECAINPLICPTYGCINTIGSYKCACPPGYEFGPDDVCQDIDECKIEHACAHRCINTIGSYLCACHEGFIVDSDGKTCVGPAGCLYQNVLYPAGTSWTIDGCSQCTCDMGVTQCTECPPQDNEDCMYKGILYRHLTNWTSLFNACEHCFCNNSNVQCMEEICDELCTHPVPRAGVCCHECTDCLSEGTLIRNNQYFTPSSSNCTVCRCENGNVKCSNLTCPEITCSKPTEGPCCLTCEDTCVYEGNEYGHGETFIPESPKCSICTCLRGAVECQYKSCPELDCPAASQVRIKGQCCSTCVEMLPGCVDNQREFHRTGDQWQDPMDLCRTCSCSERGRIQCFRTECNTQCRNPVSIAGQCCPDCHGCVFNGVGRRNGESFTTLNCDQCVCIYGDVVCEPASCNTECYYPYQPPGECCPICQDCFFLSQRIKDGETTHPALDPCRTCMCRKGNVRCTHAEQCPTLDCSVTTTVAGECCPRCADGFCRLPGGQTYESGESWFDRDDPCTECTCFDQVVRCLPLPCPDSSNCTHGLILDGECCADCSVCMYRDIMYNNEEVFTPENSPCDTCTCMDGSVNCVSRECPPLACRRSVDISGLCCPVCAVCIDPLDSTEYTHGQTWVDENNPCRTCICADGEIRCSEVTCLADCKNATQVDGQCCPTCQGCDVNGQTLPVGTPVKPDDSQCMECVCGSDGQLQCFAILCPKLNCRPEQVAVTEGSCCPSCEAMVRTQRVCENDGIQYSNGTTFDIDQCTTCTCIDGYLDCQVEECPERPCSQHQLVRVPDECCPLCLDQDCLFDNRFLINGEWFQPAGDKCTNCSCNNGQVECALLPCPALDCHPDEQHKAEGDCCPQCTAGMCLYNGERYSSSTAWRSGCDICVCINGNAVCSQEECEPVTCKEGDEIGIPPGACCEQCLPKMASCIVFGDPHYRTFDGRFHDFQGTCTYTFVKDCVGENFEVIVQNNGKETYSVSWTQLVSFRLFNWTIDLLQDMKVKVDGAFVELPYLHEPEFSIQKLGLLVVVHTNLGITVSFDGEHFAEVVADHLWKGQLCGLCGDYNDNPDDDFRSRNGTYMTTASDFGNTFICGDYPDCSCRESQELEPCAKDESYLVEAVERCEILKGDVFSPAHHLIDPQPFYDACLYDWCACPAQDKCLCDVLSAYSHEARKKGVRLDWQRENYCAISCPARAYYDECTPPCEITCESLNSPNPPECTQNDCVPGCKCPAGMVLHNFQCIDISNCP
ncbi:uncharacterized protein LOC110982993 isoform X2 [Acanthaster planci]|uniref:Uncharacterized protein LOC110982993 isoform X2 n=1 Tax=Acanthaster planci TaxID=133434 RepID=A0A8B7YW29_ACAPL|nr:uncharacterized protein LOC110982993 isoform X2 [Acanthaster planci]